MSAAAKVVDFTKTRAEQEAWGEPELFDATNLPEFPVDALATWQREWCAAEATFTQTPIDLPAGIALAATSLPVSRVFRVQVREGWAVSTNLWIVVAAPPAERKSPVFADATEPMYEYVQDERDRLAPLIADRARDRRILQAQIEEAEKAAAKGKTYGGGDARQAARELQARFADLPEIHPPTLITDDATTEALATVMADNDECVGTFSAEGGVFELMSGRYSERGSNFELYLKAHNGDPHIVHRVRRGETQLRRPLLSMGLCVQPSVVAGLAAKDGFRGRGLLARFWYALPQTALGRRLVDPPPMSVEVRGAYHAALVALLGLGTDDRVMRMSPEADRARAALQGDLEPRLGPDGDLHAIGDWAGKLVGGVCRVAGVLHAADHAHRLDEMPDEIPVATFERAARIGDHYLHHALAAFAAMGADDVTELAKRTWAWVQRRQLREFSERDAYRALHLKTAEEIKPAIEQLVARRLVRPKPPQGSDGRPPSPVYEVRP